MLNGSDHKKTARGAAPAPAPEGSPRMATGTEAGGKQTIRNETKRCAKSCSCTLNGSGDVAPVSLPLAGLLARACGWGKTCDDSDSNSQSNSNSKSKSQSNR